jgi:hypothetical protein
MAGVWALLGKKMQSGVNAFANSRSARVVAILGASTLEEMLRRTLEYRFRESSVATEAFERGFLNTMHARMQLAYLLEMYGKNELVAVTGIAEMRNKFAHRLDVHSFNDSSLDEHFKKLKLHTLYKKFPHPFAEGDSDENVPSPSTRRGVFIVNLQLLLTILLRDYGSHFSHSNHAKPLGKLPRDFPIPASHRP